MPRPIEQLPQIRTAITFYRVMSYVTGALFTIDGGLTAIPAG